MENLYEYKELIKEVNVYRVASNKKENYVYKSHIVIITYHGESTSIMLHDYQLDGIIDLFNNSTNVVKDISIQIYEIGRTVFRNF